MIITEAGPCSCGLFESDETRRHADNCSHWIVEAVADWLHTNDFVHDFNLTKPPRFLRVPLARRFVAEDGWETIEEALQYIDEEVREWGEP